MPGDRLKRFAGSFLAVLMATAAAAQAIGPGPARQANLAAVRRWCEAQRAAGGGHVRVWPGVVADLRERTVTVIGEAVGLGQDGVVEFVLVSENSDKDYEALAVALAKPSDIALALEALGMPRGRPVQPRAFHFWPRGERVTLAVRPFAGGGLRPLGDYIHDKESRAGMTNVFTYVGSLWEGGECAANGETPGSVISGYNAPTTVIDLTFAVTQNAAYGRYVARGVPMKRESLWQFVLRPELPEGAPPRVVGAVLTALPAPGLESPATGLAGVAWQWSVTGRTESASFDHIAREVMALDRAGREPHLEVCFDDGLSVAAAAEAAAVVLAIEGVNGARLDGPPAGQLFLKAFLPQPQWRERERRLLQPYELRIERAGDGGWKRTFVYIHEDWSVENSLDPKLSVRPMEFREWPEMAAKVDELGAGIGTLLVFAPADAPLSSFMEGVRLVQAKLPTVYVLPE